MRLRQRVWRAYPDLTARLAAPGWALAYLFSFGTFGRLPWVWEERDRSPLTVGRLLEDMRRVLDEVMPGELSQTSYGPQTSYDPWIPMRATPLVTTSRSRLPDGTYVLYNKATVTPEVLQDLQASHPRLLEPGAINNVVDPTDVTYLSVVRPGDPDWEW